VRRRRTAEPPFWKHVARMGVLVGVVSGVVSLIVAVSPVWHSKHPSSARATIEKVTVGGPIDFGAYLDRLSLSRAPYSPAQLKRLGLYVQARIATAGYAGQPLHVEWILSHRGNGDIVARDRSIAIVPRRDRPQDEGVGRFWVPLTGKERGLELEVAVYQPDGKVSLDSVTRNLR
jgi:hypothetical protein